MDKGVGQKDKRKNWKEVGLQRGPHKIGGLGTCKLLMNYLTQTNLMNHNIKVI